MKSKKQNKTKWYLFLDGKTATIHDSIAEIDLLKGVVIEITADVAASVLLLEKGAKTE